jgi:hypothetical protein
VIRHITHIRLKFKHHSLGICVGLLFVMPVIGCGGGSALKIPPPIPNDEQNIPPPEKRSINIIADGFDKQFSKPMQRALDISRQLRRLTGHRQEAFNVDAFDEVGNSSWYTNRNDQKQMTLEQIKQGPNRGEGPETIGPWTIIGAKTEGVTPGFTIEDHRGGRYVIKFDPKGWQELATGAEVVSTKLLYAAGYNTPENYIVFFDPAILELGDEVMMVDKKTGKKRPMTQADLDTLLAGLDPRTDGTIRAVASKFLSGKVLGPFRYYGTRKDDPNDFIPHDYRRELRGLRTIASWINHYDTKAGNTLDMYVEEDGRHFVRHYLIDFGSTLGSQGDEPMPEWVGYETVVDPGQMTKNTLGVGLYVPAWEKGRTITYRSIGLFDYEAFQPQKFEFIVPNPAFVNRTSRDGFWGARIVTSFSDEQIRAAVETGQYTNLEAADYLTDVLIKRRDIIGRYWFDKMNPADEFTVEETVGGQSQFRCVDLAVERGYKDPSQARYQYELKRDGQAIGSPGEMGQPMRIPLPKGEQGILEVRLRNQRANGKWGTWVSAFLTAADNPGGYSIIAVQRQD